MLKGNNSSQIQIVQSSEKLTIHCTKPQAQFKSVKNSHGVEFKGDNSSQIQIVQSSDKLTIHCTKPQAQN